MAPEKCTLLEVSRDSWWPRQNPQVTYMLHLQGASMCASSHLGQACGMLSFSLPWFSMLKSIVGGAPQGYTLVGLSGPSALTCWINVCCTSRAHPCVRLPISGKRVGHIYIYIYIRTSYTFSMDSHSHGALTHLYRGFLTVSTHFGSTSVWPLL